MYIHYFIFLLFLLFINIVNSLTILGHNTFWLFENYNNISNNVTLQSIITSPYYISYNKKVELLSIKYKNYNPDIIGLVEIDGYVTLRNINEKLNNSYNMYATNNLNQNVGLLVRKNYTAKMYNNKKLNKGANKVLHVKINDNLIEYNILLCHLKSQFTDITSNQIRNKETNIISDYIKKNNLHKKNLIMLGDFNEPDTDYLTVEKLEEAKKYNLTNIKELKTNYSLTSMYDRYDGIDYSVFYDETPKLLLDKNNTIYYYDNDDELSNIDNLMISNSLIFNNVTLDNPLKIGDDVPNEWSSDHRIYYANISLYTTCSINDSYTNINDKTSVIKKILKNKTILYDIIKLTPKKCKYYLYGGTMRNIIGDSKKHYVLNDFDVKTTCNLDMIYNILIKKMMKVKKNRKLITIMNIQIGKMNKYFADYYFNAILFDIKNNKLVNTNNLAIKSSNNKLLLPFKEKNDTYNDWWNNVIHNNTKYSKIKLIIRYFRFYFCNYKSNTKFHNYMVYLLNDYYKNDPKYFNNIIKMYSKTLKNNKKSCSNIKKIYSFIK